MVLNVHRNHKAYYGTGRRGGGEAVWRCGEREIIYLSLHCHHQNDSCIKMGSDESHFNLFQYEVMDKVTSVHKLVERKERRSRFEPRSFRLPATPYR